MYVVSVSVGPSGAVGQMVLFGVSDKLFSGESAFGWCSAHYFCHIYLSFMTPILYLLLHSRKGLSTVVQGIFWKFPCIFNSHFLCIFRYYKCSISEHSLHASQYTLLICLQGFQNKGFWLYAKQIMHCRHLIIWTLSNTHCLLQGSK
jgi:hypothetical protein